MNQNLLLNFSIFSKLSQSDMSNVSVKCKKKSNLKQNPNSCCWWQTLYKRLWSSEIFNRWLCLFLVFFLYILSSSFLLLIWIFLYRPSFLYLWLSTFLLSEFPLTPSVMQGTDNLPTLQALLLFNPWMAFILGTAARGSSNDLLWQLGLFLESYHLSACFLSCAYAIPTSSPSFLLN